MGGNRRRNARASNDPAASRTRLILTIVAALIVVAVVVARVWAWPSRSRPGAVSGPRIAVVADTVSLGDVKLHTPVEAVFRVRDVGAEPLQIIGEPSVEAVKGC
jgi:hypothetical protein